MITTAFISIAYYVVSLLISVFPSSGGFPPEFHTALDTISGYVGILDPLVPISTLVTVLGLVLLFEITVFGFKATVWVYKHIPFIGK